MALRQSDNPAP